LLGWRNLELKLLSLSTPSAVGCARPHQVSCGTSITWQRPHSRLAAVHATNVSNPKAVTGCVWLSVPTIFLGWGRREAYESRCHEDAIRQRALRFPEYIHDFDIVPIQQVCPAKRGKIGDRLRGVVCVARDIKPELEHDASIYGGLPY
jgi:hypothetical protein